MPTDRFVYGNIKFANIIFKTYHIEMGPVIIVIISMNKIGPVISLITVISVFYRMWIIGNFHSDSFLDFIALQTFQL